MVKRKTAGSRMSRALRRVTEWCRLNRHLPVEEQHRTLTQKMRGHYSYYGITGNSKSIALYAWEVLKRWRKWLARRTQGRFDWEKFNRLLKRFPLPRPRIVHNTHRLAANP